jgi:DNA polymerase-3 subunit alpha
MEKEMLGVYITGHPLDDYRERIQHLATVTSDELAQAADPENMENPGEAGNMVHGSSPLQDGMTVTAVGMISGKKTQITKNNKMMAFVELEDLYGEIDVVVFPNAYERCASAIVEDNVVVVKGKLNFKEEEQPKILADAVTGIHDVEEKLTPSNPPSPPIRDFVKVRIPAEADEQEVLKQLHQIFREHQGTCPVLIYLQNGKIVRTGQKSGVHPTLNFFDTVAELVGRANIKGRPIQN